MRVTFIQQLHRLPFRIRNFSGIDRKDNDLRHRFRASASGFPYTTALIFQILHASRPAARPTGSRSHLLPAGKIGIGAVSVADRSPATPPGMRVRTGRFEKLRS